MSLISSKSFWLVLTYIKKDALIRHNNMELSKKKVNDSGFTDYELSKNFIKKIK